jgi:hypothetical protein
MAENTKDICLYFQIHQPFWINFYEWSKNFTYNNFLVSKIEPHLDNINQLFRH